MAENKVRKISIGETKAIEKELEAFAGPHKPRGCEICRRGEDDQKLVAVGRGRHTAEKIAKFLIENRGYPSTFTAAAIYRHWYRCKETEWCPTRRSES